MGQGDDVAASSREAFSFNVKRILADLKRAGILQKDLAERLKMPSSQISRMATGMIPTPERLDELILEANKLLPIDKRLKPEDFFRDPEGLENAKEDLIRELGRRAGYEVKRT